MHVLGHDYGCVQVKFVVVPAQTALQDKVAAIVRERDPSTLAKADEQGTVGLLVVGKTAAILVLVSEHSTWTAGLSFQHRSCDSQGTLNTDDCGNSKMELAISFRAGRNFRATESAAM